MKLIFGQKKKGVEKQKERPHKKIGTLALFSMRYNIPRWYLTLGIPAGIAVLMIVGGFLTGLVSLQQSGITGTGEQISRQKQFEELAKTLETESGDTDLGTAAESPPTNPLSTIETAVRENTTFDRLLVISILVALAPYSYDMTKLKQKIKRQEKDFSTFLFELSELIRGGIDPIRAIVLLSERDIGSITKPVKIVAKQLVLGYSFEQAMRNLERLLGSKLVRNYTDLVVQASYSGGTVSDLIRKASIDMQTFITLETEKMAGLKQYTMILYTAQIILIGVAVILLTQFWPGLQGLSFQGGTSGVGFLSKADIADVTIERNLYYLIIMNGFLGGLVIGKISEGSVKDGLKHGLMIMMMGFAAWMIMITPPNASQFNINIMSYPEEGPISLPMKEKLVLNVTDSSGKPAKSVLVKFAISGPSESAEVIPHQLNADRKGVVRASIVLGDKEGPYIVNVTVGKTTASIPIKAVAPS